MKACSKCGGSYEGRRCPPCHRQYQREYYHAHPEQKRKQIERSHANKMKRAALLKSRVDQFKDVPCKDCGERYPPWVMDFDHLRDKERNVSHMVYDGLPWRSIRAEIKKCEVVCSNCHRHRTHVRRTGNTMTTESN